MDPMTATIHFVGLIVFATQVTSPSATRLAVTALEPGNKTVVAIMPRVVHTSGPSTPNWSQVQASRTTARPELPPPAGLAQARAVSPPAPARAAEIFSGPHVENHVAIIAFKPCDLLGVNGWEVKELRDGFVYVELDRDQVRFVADGANGPASLDGNLGHLGGQMQPAYTPPYSGAAAVFTIPRGSMSACRSRTPGVDVSDLSKSRIDTELKLANSGAFSVISGSKKLTFRGGAFVVAANVPPLWATTLTATTGGVPHYTVYCSMIGNSNCLLPAPSKKLENTWCDDFAAKKEGLSASAKDGVPPSVASVDFACSNTQWP